MDVPGGPVRARLELRRVPALGARRRLVVVAVGTRDGCVLVVHAVGAVSERRQTTGTSVSAVGVSPLAVRPIVRPSARPR